MRNSNTKGAITRISCEAFVDVRSKSNHCGVRSLTMAKTALVVGVVLAVLPGLPLPSVVAQTPIWCEPDVAGPDGNTPSPRPSWNEIDGKANYEEVSTNFKITKTITLLVSILEKAVQKLSGGAQIQGLSDVDGYCLCNCLNDPQKDAAYWLNVIGTSVRSSVLNALQDTLDVYINGLVERLENLADGLVETLPAFRQDIETILSDACDSLAGGCDAVNLETLPYKLYDEFSGVVQGELESLFGPEKASALGMLLGIGAGDGVGMKQVKKEAEELISFLESIANSDILDPEFWKEFILTHLQDAVVSALEDTRDFYVNNLVDKLNAVKDVVLTTIPEFREEIYLLILDVCTDLPIGCPQTPEAAMQTVEEILQELADVAKTEVESIFEQEKQQVLDILTGEGGSVTKGMTALKAEVDDLVALFSSFDAIKNLKWSAVKTAIKDILDATKSGIAAVIDESKAIAQTYTKDDLNQWIDQVMGAVEAHIQEKFANAPDVIAALEAGLHTAVNNRISAIKGALDELFEAATDYQSLIDVFAGSLLQTILDNLGDLDGINVSDLKNKVQNVVQTTQTTVDTLTDSAAAIRDLVLSATPAELASWRDQILGALEAWLTQKYSNGEQIFAAVETELLAALDARIQLIVVNAEDLVNFALDHEALLNNFLGNLQSGLISSLGEIEGCYGITKRSECVVEDGGFCEGSPPGEIAGQATPIWFPTELFKDGKTTLLFALEKLKFLDKINEFLNQNAPAWMLQAGKIINALKNAQEVIEKMAKYVDTFTEGYHLGAYSGVRPDLHMCVGYGGHGAFAKVFSFGIGDFTIEGGSKYWSANLSKKHRAQFRSGGFALSVNGKTIPLAPGIALDLQIDGFRLWDKQFPFGLGRNSDGTFWNEVGNWSLNTADVADYDSFNLVDQEALESLCCPSGDSCGSCNLTAASFFTNGYFPVEYTSDGMTYEWPREGISWEENHRSWAVFGAGLNLDLAMKTIKYEVSPPIVLFTGVFLTPFLKLDAGVSWIYDVNRLRTTIQDKLNQGLPASAQLTTSDFDREMHKFQAPDVSEDIGTGAHVAPQVGADLTVGIKLGKRFEIGITASLSVGLDVAISGMGGIVDLNRALVDALADSNPDGDDCQPIVDDNLTTYCSNKLFQYDTECENDPDCIDATSGKEPPLPSEGTYVCGEGEGVQCEQRGYCKVEGQIVLQDTTRDECERFEPGLCFAVAQTFGTVYHFEPTIQGAGTVYGLASQVPGWVDWNLELANGAAALFHSKAECEAHGHCQGLNYQGPGTFWDGVKPEAIMTYPTMVLGSAMGAAGCGVGQNEAGGLLQGQVDPSTYVPFQWQEDGEASGIVGGTFFPYQCVKKPDPKVVGWEGPDCHPLEFGYPSACGCFDDTNCAGTCASKKCSEVTESAPCTCNPTEGGECPEGRLCIDGGCLKACTDDGECGPHRICQGGGCVMANGVPYAEQVVWKTRNVAEPMHSVASYAYNDLIVSAFVGLGVKVGFRFKLFKKWREKNLVDLSKSIPILAKTFIQFQLGLEAQYQSDCEPDQGGVTNHQPGEIKRYGGAGTVEQLLDWCGPQMKSDQQNPKVDDPQTVLMENGLQGVHDAGYEMGLDLWLKNQMCIDGVPWYDYLALFEANPETIWDNLSGTYTHLGAAHDLDAAGPVELQNSLFVALGCLDAEGPGSNYYSNVLRQLLTAQGTIGQFTYVYTPMHNGVPTGPPRLVFDPDAVFLDPDAELSPANIHPAIVAQNLKSSGLGQWFHLLGWLAMFDQCTDDAPVGRMVDTNLTLVFELDPDSIEVCEKQCEPTAELPELSVCDGLFGDVNYSGAVNVADVQCSTLTVLWILGGKVLTQPSCLGVVGPEAANLNCQTGVDIADVMLAIGAVLGAPLALELDTDLNGCPDACESVCGDCACGVTENCSSCSHDCGSCSSPDAVGACCNPDLGCAVLSEGVCVAAGGSFVGENTFCGGPDYCLDNVPGACCKGTGCTEVSAVQCAAGGGLPIGAWSTCETPSACSP